MILVVNICKEKLHYYEFVKPIEDILRKNNLKFFTLGYREVQEKDLIKAEKVIICGTSLKDNEFLEEIHRFSWIKNFEKPLLGICGGMQVIAKLFFGKKGHKTEIGFFKENFKQSFLGLEGEQEVYHLHNIFVSRPKAFEDFSISEIPQAIKHEEKEIYGVLFHPEVRNKTLVTEFCKL